MVRAMRKVSIARGCDPRDDVLVPFGGAAGQHACALARELGIRELLCHPDAGLLSARGIGLAEPVRHRVTGVYRPYASAAMAGMKLLLDRMADEAVAELLADAAPRQEPRGRTSLFIADWICVTAAWMPR